MRDSDLVFGVDPDAPFLLLPSFFYTRVTGSRYLLLVTDLWPDVVFDYKVASFGLLRKILTIISIFSYRVSDRIVTITEPLKENIQRYYVPAEKVDVVELAVNLSVFTPKILSNGELDSLNLPFSEERFTVLYSGSLSVMYDFDAILNAAEMLRDYKDIFFIIRGHGDMKGHILNQVSERRLTNVLVRGIVPDIETVVKYINLANVCLVPLTETPGGDITHPSKLFEFWACGKPVIVISKGELSALMKKVGGGIALDIGSSQALADAILELYNDPEKVEKMGSRGLAHVASRFSTSVMKENLSKVIKRIM